MGSIPSLTLSGRPSLQARAKIAARFDVFETVEQILDVGEVRIARRQRHWRNSTIVTPAEPSSSLP